MNAPFPSTATPPMLELTVHNPLIGNRAALDAAWERDGYWFFRDVVDQGALARLRARYLKYLGEDGVIDRGRTDAAVWNGASLEHMKVGAARVVNATVEDPLVASNPRQDFLADPAIHALFRDLIGDEPFWVPITEYRTEKPNRDRIGSRFSYIHCDCVTNPGIPFIVCWLPVVTIDEEMGGLAVAEGLHRPRENDFPRVAEGIPLESIPAETWRRTVYQPGDLLMFHGNLPHSGLANYSSSHFRLSLDLRVVRASDNVPTLGTIAAIGSDTVTVRTDDGALRSFRLDVDTRCRDYLGVKKIPYTELQANMPVGSAVIVAAEDGLAKMVRPPR